MIIDFFMTATCVSLVFMIFMFLRLAVIAVTHKCYPPCSKLDRPLVSFLTMAGLTILLNLCVAVADIIARQ